MARPRKKLDARLLRKVEKWLLKEEKPLSFVLGELKLTVKQWDVVVENDAALRDVLDMLALKEQELLLNTIKTSKQHAVTGAIFLAKSRHGFVDNHKPEPTETKVNVQVMLPPPAKSDAEFARLINPPSYIEPTQVIEDAVVLSEPAQLDGEDLI